MHLVTQTLCLLTSERNLLTSERNHCSLADKKAVTRFSPVPVAALCEDVVTDFFKRTVYGLLGTKMKTLIS